MPYIPAKLLYTFLFACQGSAPVYLGLFYSEQLGLKRDQIGLLAAIAPFVSAIACPLWTAVADKTKTHRYIMCIIHTLATIAIVSVMGIPVVVQNIEDTKARNSLTIALAGTASLCFAFFGVPVGPLVDGGVLKILGKNKDQYGRQRMFGSISFGIASSLVGAIADWTQDMNAIFYVYATSSVFFILVAGNTFFKAEKVELISKPFLTRTSSRSSGFRASPSASSDTMEVVTHNEGDGSRARRKVISTFSVQDPEEIESDEDDLLPIRENEIQRLMQFATDSSIIEAVNLSNPPASRRRSSAGGDNISIDSSYSLTEPTPTTFLELIRQPPVFLFFITMMLMGVAINMVVSFFFIFLRDELEASSTLTGMTGLVGAATELLFFFYSRDLIRTIGIKSLIVLGHVLTIVRVFAYTLLPKGASAAWIALALHLLNGIAFSALWGAGVVQADELAPPSLQATSQGVLAAMYAGIGAGLGSLIGGVIYQNFGAKAMFYTVIAVTSFSLELYLEVNTPYGLRSCFKALVRVAHGIWQWIEYKRGRGRVVPRWRAGAIRLDDEE
ncbi:unnamed protein product [Umbelopsis ramanniana]